MTTSSYHRSSGNSPQTILDIDLSGFDFGQLSAASSEDVF